MRVVFLSSLSAEYAYLIGRVLPLARVLLGAGHQVQVLALHHDWAALAERTALCRGVPVRYVGAMHVHGLGDARRQLRGAALLWVALAATLRLTRAALALPADLYHVGKPLPFNSVAGLLASRLRRRPLYVDCDDYEAASTRFTGRWQRGILRRFEDGMPRLATGVTVNTHFWEERLGMLGVPAERVAYIPNGVEVGRFGRAEAEAGRRLCRHFGLEDKATVVYVGILSLTNHPLDLLLEAFGLVARALPAAHLLLVGGGEDGAALRRRVEEVGLAGRVTFTGLVPPDEIAAYYRLARCSVDPVRDDVHARARCPLKVVESIACGVPVVTGDVGDRRELVGQGGLLVRPGSSVALAEGIQRLLTDAEQRSRMSREALGHAARYHWDRLGHEVLRFYERTMGR